MPQKEVVYLEIKENKGGKMGAMRPDQGRPHSGLKHLPGKDASSLKGTLVGVLFVGGVIAATWLSVFFLFLSRM
jgi:hypothetical protein